MFVLLFAYVFGGAIAVQGSNYREYLIAGILLQSLAFGLTGPATAIATDLTEGVIDRFRSLPSARSADGERTPIRSTSAERSACWCYSRPRWSSLEHCSVCWCAHPMR